MRHTSATTKTVAESYERLETDESITGATIPAGRYGFSSIDAFYSFGPQRFF